MFVYHYYTKFCILYKVNSEPLILRLPLSHKNMALKFEGGLKIEDIYIKNARGVIDGQF